MGSQAVRAGAAFVEIGAKTGLFDSALAMVQTKMRGLAGDVQKISAQMKSAAGGMSSFGKSTMGVGAAVAGLGVAGIAGMVGMTKQFADAGSAVDDMAQRTGLAAEEVSGLSYAALMSGTSIGSVEKAIRKMQASGTGAGNGTMADFLELASSVAAIENPSERAAAAIKAFGKSGAELLPMLADGGDGIEALIREAESLGLVMSGTDAKAAAALGDSMDKLWKVVGAVSMSIGASLAPTLMSIGENLVYAGTIVRQFIEDHREWVVMAAKVGAVVALVGGALVAFGATVAGLGFIMAGLGAAFTVAASAVGAILSPIGLVIIGVASLGAAIAYQSGAIGTALGWMQTKWQELLNFVMPIIEGIKNAMVQGKWAEAGQIAMLGLQLAFRTGLEPIYGLWTDLQTFLIMGTAKLVANMANVFAGIPTALMNGFSTVITWLTGTWEKTVNAIAKKLLYLYSLFDSSVNYEKAAAQMDKEAAQRAGNRQKELDAATAQRNKALADANQARLKYADDLTSNVRQDAAARKEQFGANNASLREELRKLIADVNESAPKPSTEPPAKDTRLEGAKTTSQTVAAELPGSGADSTDANKGGGTFSGFAAGMIGNQSPLLKLAEVSKKSLDALVKIEENTREDFALALE